MGQCAQPSCEMWDQMLSCLVFRAYVNLQKPLKDSALHCFPILLRINNHLQFNKCMHSLVWYKTSQLPHCPQTCMHNVRKKSQGSYCIDTHIQHPPTTKQACCSAAAQKTCNYTSLTEALTSSLFSSSCQLFCMTAGCAACGRRHEEGYTSEY